MLNQPNRMGYVPDPLVFVCSDCGLLTEFDDVDDLCRRWSHTQSRVDCLVTEAKRHNWRQLDVIFAHWSGNYCGLSPYRWLMSRDGRVDQAKTCRNCGHNEYRLVNRSSPFFSDWKFQCVKCMDSKEIVQADRETLLLLKPRMDQDSGNLPKEWNMLPVSYRASSTYYVQRDSFILFNDTDAASLLGTARRDDLLSLLMQLYNFPGTALTQEEIIRQLRQNGREVEATEYQGLAQISAMPVLPASEKALMEKQLYDKRQQYQAAGLIAQDRQHSPLLAQQVEKRGDWARKFDPIRLAVEHRSLRSEVIDPQGSDPSLPSISVTNPEVCDIDKEDVRSREVYTTDVKSSLDQLGVHEMVMLRGLDICEFSFGYSRVGSTPSTSEKDWEMPVCLKAFSHVEKNKRPIYLLEQKNEGFYVKLKEARVIDWLMRNGFADAMPPRGGMRLGGILIEEYADFGRFLEEYRERTAESRTERSLASYVYLLLHTMAHHFARCVVEYSGLDHGSIGEYLFPSDLAFLVYRRGMMPDLGNLSAMWRNYGLVMLDVLLGARGLKCDSGSLCDQRGGACPACIMAPEVACLAGNNLLSRAVLNGGVPPGWDNNRNSITGYFQRPRI